MFEDILVLSAVSAIILLLLIPICDGASIYAKDLWSYYKETDNKFKHIDK